VASNEVDLAQPSTTADAPATEAPAATVLTPEPDDTATQPEEPAAGEQPTGPAVPQPAASILAPVTLPCSFSVGDSRTEWVVDVHHDDWRRVFAQQLRAIADTFDPPASQQLVWPDGAAVDPGTVAALIDQNGAVIPASSIVSTSTMANTSGASTG
jgi:hypothetical protein